MWDISLDRDRYGHHSDEMNQEPRNDDEQYEKGGRRRRSRSRDNERAQPTNVMETVLQQERDRAAADRR